MSASNRMTPTDVTPEAKRKFEESAEETSRKDMDFLGVDNTIPGQSWVCLSFISPETMIKERNKFYFTQFLNSLTQPLELPDEVKLDHSTKFEELVKNGVTYDAVNDAWEDFLHVNGENLSRKFEETTDGRTSVRGLKVRGVYATWQEAKERSDRLAELDKSHHVYVAQVGYWLPWDPAPMEVPEQEYQNKQLNELMKRYEENLACRDQFYEQRKREKLREAMERSKKEKEEKEVNSEATGATGATGPTETPPEVVPQSMDELDKLRKIVQEKDALLLKMKKEKEKKKKENQQVEEDKKLLENVKATKARKSTKSTKSRKSKKKGKKVEAEPNDGERELPTLGEGEEVSTKEEIQDVFNSEDPWMSRKKDST